MLLYGSLPIDNRVDREIRALVKKKHNVTILDTEMGYGEWKGCEGAKRIPIIRLPVSKRQSIGGLVRFWLACFKYLHRSRESIDVVHVHDLTGLPPAWLITTIVPRIRFVYDAHELFPEAARDRMTIWHYMLFLGIEIVCACRVDYLISPAPMALRILAKRLGGNPVLLMNVPDLQRARENLGEIPSWTGKNDSSTRKIAYSGNVLPLRGYKELVEVAKILNEDSSHKYEFWIIGDGPYLDTVKSMAESMNIADAFVFTGRVPFEELLSLTSLCDIAVALYSEPMAHLGLSNKMFEYMMLGMPFLYPDARQSFPILSRIGAVIIDNPVNAENLAESILLLLNDSKQKEYISKEGRRLIADYFNWQIESQKLILMYENLLLLKSH
jgi:glycosyltransferase involved in cell wall biosynthesis